MASNPLKILSEAVVKQTGRARSWHHEYLHNHTRRYLVDLQLVAALAPAGKVLEIGSAPCHMTALLTLSAIRLVGVDLDPGRVADFVRDFALDVRRCDIERSRCLFATDRSAAHSSARRSSICGSIPRSR